ncbi:hypothetical protein NQ317_019273 [Molorchus minor]|uniref:Regulatory protein zeste n=1 Tax=Molorchus minor TaxID=1323400 RepID=A0ABQ9JWP7_9CUCU|nr:hypothetical protein NQ317_019273 [Molorchus minor]
MEVGNRLTYAEQKSCQNYLFFFICCPMSNPQPILRKKDEKKRSANFIIGCKMTDVASISEKANCWKKIETEFNAINVETPRSDKVLRKKYGNMKKEGKEKNCR